MVGTSVGWVEDFKKNSLGFTFFFLTKWKTHQVWVFVLPIPWVDGSRFNGSCWFQVQGRANFRPLCEIVLLSGCRLIPGFKV